MAQYIKNADLFGRIGSGIGQGLAEQFPKEMERGRLASGLKNFEQEHANLNPMQQLARLSAIPGITPQMIQSFSELAKHQNQGNAYRNSIGEMGRKASPDLTEIKQAALLDRASSNGIPMEQGVNAQSLANNQTVPIENNQRTPNLGRVEDIPQVAQGNPLNQQNLSRPRWTPQERNALVADYISQGFLPDKAQQLAADDEAIYLGEPEAYKQRQSDIKNAKTEARAALTRHLELKLQKTGENLFKDVEGPMINNAERGMIRDLIDNPRADIDNVANDWSERLYRTAIAKGKLKTMGQTTGIENLLKGKQSSQQLKDYQDIFKRSGNLEEFKNILQGSEIGMSPQAAASVAYPVDKKISSYISSIKVSPTPLNIEQKARKAAIDIEKLGLNADDSLLSIAKSLKAKDPYFDEQAFFDQISEDKDQLGLNERQRLELSEPRNFLPNWADILYLPIFRR